MRNLLTLTFVFFFLTFDPAFSADCVEEGGYVGNYPNAKQCCDGLEMKSIARGASGYGNVGSCEKKIRNTDCVEEGGYVGDYPNAKQCCEDLDLVPIARGASGPGIGSCEKIRNTDCVREGGYVGNYPKANQCCKGLDLVPIAPGASGYGSAGSCELGSAILPLNVNDSQNQTKEPQNHIAPVIQQSKSSQQ